MLFFISSANSVNAQWAEVDSSGIAMCFADDGNYIYAGFLGAVYSPGDTSHPATLSVQGTTVQRG